MTHTSTEQPEALRLASVIATPKRPAIDLRNRVATELRRLHSRVQELEASQAQRVPLDAFDVGCLVESAGYSQIEAQRKSDFINGIRYAEIRHGITQNKKS